MAILRKLVGLFPQLSRYIFSLLRLVHGKLTGGYRARLTGGVTMVSVADRASPTAFWRTLYSHTYLLNILWHFTECIAYSD